MNFEIVKSRIAGRHMAEGLFDLLEPKQREDSYFMAKLVETLALKCGLRVQASREPEATEEFPPFERVRNFRIPFGIHHGKTLDSVPLDYLDWLCGEQEIFNGTLRAYLKHPQLKNHIRDFDR